MELAEFVQKFFLLLVPGIVGMLLYNQLNIHEERSAELEILKLICLSLAAYAVEDVLFQILSFIPAFPWEPVHILEEIASPEIRLPAPNVFAALCAAVCIACVLTRAREERWLFRMAERLSLTERIGNQPVWEMAFDYGNAVVLRDLVTGNIYYGKVMVFSDNSDIREILLQDVNVYNQSAQKLYHTDILYLSREHNQFTMEMRK